MSLLSFFGVLVSFGCLNPQILFDCGFIFKSSVGADASWLFAGVSHAAAAEISCGGDVSACLDSGHVFKVHSAQHSPEVIAACRFQRLHMVFVVFRKFL